MGARKVCASHSIFLKSWKVGIRAQALAMPWKRTRGRTGGARARHDGGGVEAICAVNPVSRDTFTVRIELTLEMMDGAEYSGLHT